MSKSVITSPAHSEGAVHRQKSRRTLSVASPARSDNSGKLASVVAPYINDDKIAFSPVRRRSVLSDNTEIEAPRRASWWKRLEGSSRDVLEVLDTNKMQVNLLLEEFDVEVEKEKQSQSVAASSGNESVASIVVPQKKLFNRKKQSQGKFGEIMGSRKSNIEDHDDTINYAPKNLFNKGQPRNRPVFPAALLNSTNKTINKTVEPDVNERQGRNLFGQVATKRKKNMFTDFLLSESEDDSEIQHKVFGFKKRDNKRISLGTRNRRMPSLTPSMTTDLDIDDWKLLPSSTMIGNGSEASEASVITNDEEIEQMQLENRDVTLTETDQSLKLAENNHKTSESRANRTRLNKSTKHHHEFDKTVTNENIDLESASKNQNINLISESGIKNKSQRCNKTMPSENHKDKTLLKENKTVELGKIGEQENEINEQTTDVEASVEDKLAELHEMNGNKEKGHDAEPMLEHQIPSNVKETNENQDDEMEILRKDNDGAVEIEHMEVQNQDVTITEAYQSSKIAGDNHNTSVGHKNQSLNRTRLNKSTKHIDDNDGDVEIEHMEVQNQDVIITETNKSSKIAEDNHNTNVDRKNQSLNRTRLNKSAKHIDDNDGAVEIEHMEVQNRDVTITKAYQSSKIAGDNHNTSVGHKNQSLNRTRLNKSTKHIDDNDGDVEIEHMEVQNRDVIITEANQSSKIAEDNYNTNVGRKNQSLNRTRLNKSAKHSDDNDSAVEIEHVEVQNRDVTITEVKQSSKIAEDNHNTSVGRKNQSLNRTRLNKSTKHIDDKALSNENIEVESASKNQNIKLISESMNKSQRHNKTMPLEKRKEETLLKENKTVELGRIGEQKININEHTIIEDDGEPHENGNLSEQAAEVSDGENDAEETENEVDLDEAEDDTEDIEEKEDQNKYNEDKGDPGNSTKNVSINKTIPAINQKIVELLVEKEEIEQENEVIQGTPNASHDITHPNTKNDESEVKSPEVVLRNVSKDNISFKPIGRSTSFRKSCIEDINLKPSLIPIRETTFGSEGSRCSSTEGSGWDSHRTTRKTLRQTFGRDFTQRKSLRALVMEQSAKRKTHEVQQEIESESDQHEPQEIEAEPERDQSEQNVSQEIDNVSPEQSDQDSDRDMSDEPNRENSDNDSNEHEDSELDSQSQKSNRTEPIVSDNEISDQEKISEHSERLSRQITDDEISDQVGEEEIEEISICDRVADLTENHDVSADSARSLTHVELENNEQSDQESDPDMPDEADCQDSDDDLNEQSYSEPDSRSQRSNRTERIVFDNEISEQEIDYEMSERLSRKITDNESSNQVSEVEEEMVVSNRVADQNEDHAVDAGNMALNRIKLEKIAQQCMEMRLKIREKVQNSHKQNMDSNFFLLPMQSKLAFRRIKPEPTQPKRKPRKPVQLLMGPLPKEFMEDLNYKPPKRFQPATAPWITKRLYRFLESKLEPKYDYRARVRAEQLVQNIYAFTKIVRRRDPAPQDAIDDLKREMARLKIVTTHFDFYEFFHEFMPREIRVRVNPDAVNKIPKPRAGVFSDIL